MIYFGVMFPIHSMSASKIKMELYYFKMLQGSSKKLTQKHVRLLEPQKDIFLNIDGFTSGVGCVNSWGALPLDQYRQPYDNYQYSYWLIPNQRN